MAHKATFGNICGCWSILYVANEVLFPLRIMCCDIALNIASHKAIYIKDRIIKTKLRNKKLNKYSKSTIWKQSFSINMHHFAG